MGMPAYLPRRHGNEADCTSVSVASTVPSLAIDGRREATDVGYGVGVGRDVAGSRWRAWFGALALLFVGACSDGDDVAPTSQTSSVTTAVASTTAVTTTTTSTSSTSTTTTTTAVPSTTVDPVSSAEVDVRAAIDLAQATFSDCLVAMPVCDPSTLAVARAGDLLARNVARIGEWNAAGYTVIDRDQFRYVIESVVLGDDPARVTAVVCIADGSKLVLPDAAPDGGDVIIDDVYISGRSGWDMRLDGDGRWRAYDAPAVGSTESTDQCSA
jgi:hypothetical protein